MNPKKCHALSSLMTLFFLSFLNFFLSGCTKHGEEDPWISFVTRNNRLCRSWQLDTYNMDDIHNIQTGITFTNTACDTGNVGGVHQTNYRQLNEYARVDTLLQSQVTKVENNAGGSKTFQIKMTYVLNINDDGTYHCSGDYRFYDADRQASVQGSFASQSNSWFWKTGKKTDYALELLNFPTIDVGAIADDGLPIRYITAQTFDMPELRQDVLQLESESKEHYDMEQIFDPYNIYMPFDTLFNCSRTVLTDDSRDVLENWRFVEMK